MSFKRVLAVLQQEYYLTIHSMETIFDVFIYSFISLFIFGFISNYLVGGENLTAARYLLLGLLLWEVVRIVQYSISMGSMWNIWSRNLSNMFIAPLSVIEYFTAHTLSGIAKAGLVLIIDAAITSIIFQFHFLDLGIMVVAYFLLLAWFGFSTGIAIIGVIFRFGTRIQAFSWGIVPILQPLTAAFFPVSVLPKPLQALAWSFPTTYVFEAARFQLDTGQVDWRLLIFAILLNCVYVVAAVAIFSRLFQASRDSGQFARNET